MFNKPKVSKPSIVKIGIIGLAIILITLSHYQTAPEAGMRHVVFRELYFLPIILGGFWFGLRGGIATALVISILYGPLVIKVSGNFSAHDFGNIMEILLFGVVGGLLGWMRDRQVSHQAKLLEAENLAAVGRATSMIAHDLKTPLVTIGGLAKQLSRKITPGTAAEEKIMVIQQQTERLERLVADMLFFAKPLQLKLGVSDICDLLGKAKETVNGKALQYKVAIELPQEKSCSRNLDPAKMLLVLINLFANAIEASPPNETVLVSLRYQQKKLLIDISDRGEGISTDIKDKVFEPFVTSKKNGTGLGLPICRKIIEAHAGELTYSNNSGGGTTFSISLS